MIFRYSLASFKKLAMISRITSPIGNAAMMDTLCRFAIELSEKVRAIGSRINIMDQNIFT